MNVLEVAPGLWRWTALHPDWTPQAGGPEGWDQEVGSVYYETPDGVVLIDPLVPDEAADRFWGALDGDVERVGRRVDVLITIFWHARSAGVVRDRYGARVWAYQPARELIQERTEPTDVFRAGDELPGGVVALDARRPFEVLFWVPRHAALVPGDILLGTEEGCLRLCPASWLGDRDPAEVRDALRSSLADLAVERVLVSHGRPVLSNAGAALDEALA